MSYWKRNVFLGMTLAVVISSAGCAASLTLSEERDWGNLLAQRTISEPIPFKSKTVAGVLSGIIPGSGHFYVDYPGLGVAYFLGNVLWPINILWTVPAGLQATDVTNKRWTAEYYRFGTHSATVEHLRQNGKLPSDFKTYQQAGIQQ